MWGVFLCVCAYCFMFWNRWHQNFNFISLELQRHNIAVLHEMRKDSHFKEISLNEIQTREENVTLWWRHNITWSSSPNLGFEQWRRSQITSVMLTPMLGFLVSRLPLFNNRVISHHPMMILIPPEIAVHSPAGHQRALQPSFSPDLMLVMAALSLSLRRWEVTVSPKFNMSQVLIHLTLHQTLEQRDIRMAMTTQTTLLIQRTAIR